MNADQYTAAQFAAWTKDVREEKPPVTYPVAEPGHPLAAVELAPKQVLVFGAAPGRGKTALVMQMVLNAMALNPLLRALVANVEMTPEQLFNRQLARLSGVSLKAIRQRDFKDDERKRVREAMKVLGTYLPRLCIMKRPFTLKQVFERAESHRPNVVVFDYIQRIRTDDKDKSRKDVVDEVMDKARLMADLGVAVIAVSAVGRQKDRSGRSSYDNLNLASFRESSELEYGPDHAYILERDKETVILKHVKARDSEECDIKLHFDGAAQSFDPPRLFEGAFNDFADFGDVVTASDDVVR